MKQRTRAIARGFVFAGRSMKDHRKVIPSNFQPHHLAPHSKDKSLSFYFGPICKGALKGSPKVIRSKPKAKAKPKAKETLLEK